MEVVSGLVSLTITVINDPLEARRRATHPLRLAPDTGCSFVTRHMPPDDIAVKGTKQTYAKWPESQRVCVPHLQTYPFDR